MSERRRVSKEIATVTTAVLLFAGSCGVRDEPVTELDQPNPPSIEEINIACNDNPALNPDNEIDRIIPYGIKGQAIFGLRLRDLTSALSREATIYINPQTETLTRGGTTSAREPQSYSAKFDNIRTEKAVFVVTAEDSGVRVQAECKNTSNN